MDNDRNEFYKQLQYCKSRKEIEDLFETIENIELYEIIEDKYNQIIELTDLKYDKEFFDAVVSTDSYNYFGRDDGLNMYLYYGQ